jgi:hypothetical protein
MKRFTILAALALLIFALSALAAEPAHLTISNILVAGQSGNSVTLLWDANSEADLAGYKVYWGTASRTYTNTPQPTVPVSPTPTYTVGGLANGTYYFAVTAFNNAGQESGYSNEVSAVISVPPVPPTGLRIQGPLAFLITGTTVQLAWKTEDPRTSRVEYSYDGGPFRTQPVSQIEVTDHYVRLVDLTPGRIYQYEVVCETPGKDPLRASGTFRTW